MMKLIHKYLKKKNLVAVSTEDIVSYRKTRSELKQATLDYNALVETFLTKATIKQIKEVFSEIVTDGDFPNKKPELVEYIKEKVCKDFPKKK